MMFLSSFFTMADVREVGTEFKPKVDFDTALMLNSLNANSFHQKPNILRLQSKLAPVLDRYHLPTRFTLIKPALRVSAYIP